MRTKIKFPKDLSKERVYPEKPQSAHQSTQTQPGPRTMELRVHRKRKTAGDGIKTRRRKINETSGEHTRFMPNKKSFTSTKKKKKRRIIIWANDFVFALTRCHLANQRQ